MSSESAFAHASLLLTYLLKTSVVYLALWLLSRSIRNSQVRFWLDGLYLGSTVTIWLGVLSSFSLPGHSLQRSAIPDAVSSGHLLSWSVDPSKVIHIPNSLSLAFWTYVVFIMFLLTRSLGHHWRLNKFLRASQPAPDALGLVFELLRSRARIPLCELRLAGGLRSPATAGWWHPKVLLPADLLPRLRPPQLVQVLQHELTHVRRRDYLWDRLCTIGCYLIFFHPVAWLVRRALRWERELVCDESVVPGSTEARLEYASCLTSLATWWFLQEHPTGPIDFLSPRSSLLAARVRALLARPSNYGPRKKIILAMFAGCGLILTALSVPKIEILLKPTPLPVMADTQFLPSSPSMAPHTRARRARIRSKPARPMTTPIPESLPIDLSFPVVVPVLAAEVQQKTSFEPDQADSFISASSRADPGEYLRFPVWDESLPHRPRTRAAKAGAVALRVLRVGIGLAASQIGDHEHEKEH
jgi:beta-lactamase regulating signal transducer with metallopeptidase domain